MTSLPSDPAVTAWIALMRAGRAVLGAIEADMKAAGLPPLAWYDVLLELRRAGSAGLRASDLESRMLLAQYNVSRLVDRLEANGLLTRTVDPDDRRARILRTTPAGDALLARMWPVYAAAIQRHVGRHLSDEEAARLASMLGKLTG